MVLFLCVLGFVFAVSTAFSCKTGPKEFFLRLRNKLGKPFSCPYCMTIYAGVLSSLLYFLPEPVQIALGAPGWGMILLHALQIHIIYEPNRGE